MSGEAFLTQLRSCRDALVGFEPARYSGPDCVELAEELAATEKACAAARARAAARAAEAGAQSTRGFVDAGEWLARVTGSSRAEARAAIDTAAAVESCPTTKAALASGSLSLEQAREIVATEAECPGSERELIALTTRAGLATLRDEGRKRRLATRDVDELHRTQHARRSLRHWRDGEGMVCVAAALPPELGVPVVNRLEAETDRVFRQAHRDGREEPREAYAADAFLRLFGKDGATRSRSAELVLVCDVRPYRRGHTHPGEICRIQGGGPVPVSMAHELLEEDAFLKVVFHDGTRIDTVAHLGRHIPATLHTALELGAPPDFDGRSCVEEGCDRRYGLQWDHVDPVANDGPTSYENLKPRCPPHHRKKTEADRLAGLLGDALNAVAAKYSKSGRALP